MDPAFSPRLDILPLPQQRLWPELAGIPDHFVLYGGTALALRLGHRDSVDFDFFSDREFQPMALYESLPFLKGASIVQSEANTLTCLADRDGDVKLSFFGLPHLARINPPDVCADNALRIASLLDLAATKAAVVQQRAQAKDYLDIDALISAGVPLGEALAAARVVYGDAFAPTPTIKALAYFGDGDLSTLPDDVKQRLVAAATAVNPIRLPSLKRNAEMTSNTRRDEKR
jgi:hypothetical protein